MNACSRGCGYCGRCTDDDEGDDMRQEPHTHPCEQCGAQVECSDGWEPNFDGIPEVICLSYQQPSGAIADVLCEACADAQDAAGSGWGV